MKTFTSFLSWLSTIVIGFALLACNNEEQSLPIKVDCLTQDASEITTNSAILRGIAIIENANGQEAKAYFYFSPYYTDIEDLKASGTRINAGTVPSEGGTFEATLSGLIGGTSYYFAASVAIDGKESFGQVGAFMTVSKPAELTVTAEASNITETTATLYGFANLTDEMSNAEFGIIISTDDNPSSDNGVVLKTNELNSENKYNVQAKDLKPATVYYYKSFVSKGSTLRVGEVKSFTTNDFTASVTTINASDIGLFDVTISGKLNVQSIDNLSKSVSFLYSKSASSLEELIKTGYEGYASLEEDGTFYKHISSLNYGTTYYYVACAKVHDRNYYGEVKSFETSEFGATVTTLEASNIGMFTADIQGSISIDNADNLSVNVWFLYSNVASGLEGIKTSGTKVTSTLGSDGAFSRSLSSLSYNTTYYYVACAKVHDKEYYGKVKSFTTSDISVSISTLPASQVTMFNAGINGQVVVNNTEALNKTAFFIYSTQAADKNSLLNTGTKLSASIDGEGRFTRSLSSLQYNTTYYYLAGVNVHDKTFYGEVKSFKTSDFSATVTTNIASDIGLFKASLSGNVTINSDETLTASARFLYSESENTLEGLKSKGISKTVSSISNGSFGVEINQLSYGKRYYYVACCKILDKEFYGQVKSFSTNDLIVKCETKGATDIEMFSGIIKGYSYVENWETGIGVSRGLLFSNKYSTLDDLKQYGVKIYSGYEDDYFFGEGIEKGTFIARLSNLDCESKYYYVAYVKAYDKECYGEVKSFTTADLQGIDLGLSILWSPCNLGAKTPSATGDFYAWGETSTKSEYTSENYAPSGNDPVATNLGGGWRWPSRAEIEELVNQCKWTEVTINNVKAYKATGPNGESIFFPLTGYYYEQLTWAGSYCICWSSELVPQPNTKYYAYGLYLYSAYSAHQLSNMCTRSTGNQVRPVRSK